MMIKKSGWQGLDGMAQLKQTSKLKLLLLKSHDFYMLSTYSDILEALTGTDGITALPTYTCSKLTMEKVKQGL